MKTNFVPKKGRRMPRLVRKGCESVYHVVSRVNGRAFLLKDVEKELFRDLLGRVAGFCGVQVLAFAVLDNHFHLLVRVPESPGDPSDDELRARAALIYGKQRRHQPLSCQRIDLALRAGGSVRDGMRQLLMERMASLPMFVKLLKQRFSILYNHTHGRVGTLWEDRYHSVLVENTAVALQAVAAYIDLNPVRAGLVDDPKDYRFSGYGEAMGRRKGPEGYGLFQALAAAYQTSAEKIAAAYRSYLYVKGSDPRKGRTFTEAALKKVRARQGELSPAERLRCRLRYMTQGVIIGTRAFVEAQCAEWRKPSKGRAPRSPAADSTDSFVTEGLCALRRITRACRRGWRTGSNRVV